MASSLETLRSVERQLITRVGQNVAADEARRAVDQAWREIINMHEWSWVRRATELAIQTVAPKQDGTISVPRGSRTVTGVGTSFDTGDARSKIVLEDSAYLVEAAPSATELTLFKPYIGADITDKSYLLYKDLYRLDDDVYEILTMTGPVDVVEQTTLDEVFQLTSPISLSEFISYPSYFYYTNLLEDGTQEIGLYPPPDAAYHMPYAGLRRSAMTRADQVLSDISPTVLHRATALAWLIVAAKAFSDSDWRKKSEAERIADKYDGYYQHTVEEYIIVDQQRFGQTGQTDFRRLVSGRTDLDLNPFGDES